MGSRREEFCMAVIFHAALKTMLAEVHFIQTYLESLFSDKPFFESDNHCGEVHFNGKENSELCVGGKGAGETGQRITCE